MLYNKHCWNDGTFHPLCKYTQLRVQNAHNWIHSLTETNNTSKVNKSSITPLEKERLVYRICLLWEEPSWVKLDISHCRAVSQTGAADVFRQISFCGRAKSRAGFGKERRRDSETQRNAVQPLILSILQCTAPVCSRDMGLNHWKLSCSECVRCASRLAKENWVPKSTFIKHFSLLSSVPWPALPTKKVNSSLGRCQY